MSAQDNSHDTAGAGTAQNAEGAGGATQDLKRILHALADQIADEDERRVDLFSSLKDRLNNLDADVPGGDTAQPRAWREEQLKSGPAALRSGIAERGQESGAADAGEGVWDAGSAEALTQVYEREAGIGAAGGQQADTGANAVGSDANAVLNEDELALLFLEIADKLDNVIAAMPTEDTFEALDARLSALEDGVGRASQNGGNIGALQDQISDVAGHIMAAQQNFGRLDKVEAELRELAERMSDERLAVLSGSTTLGPQELEVISQQIAEKLSGTLPTAGSAGDGDAQGAGETRETLQRFMAERREGEEHTAMMLDTMQQALIRLLDRIDELEFDRPARALQGGFNSRPDSAMHDMAADMTAGGAKQVVNLHQESAAEAAVQDAGADHEIQNEPEGDGLSVAADADMPAPIEAEAAAAGMPEQPEASKAQEDGAEKDDAANSVAAQPAAGEDKKEEPEAKPLSGRAALVASARRAAQQAALQRAKEEEEAAKKKGGKAKGKGRSWLSRSPISIGAVVLLGLGIGYNAHGLMGQMQGAGNFFPGMLDPMALATAEPKGEPDAVKVVMPVNGEGEAAGGAAAAKTPADEEISDQAAAIKAKPVEATPDVERRYPGMPAGAKIVRVALDPSKGKANAGLGAVGNGNSKLELPPSRIGPMSLRLAAANGDPSAEFEVASRFAEGKGIGHDLQEAVGWYKRSASKGFAAAQYRLGTLYERGVGTARDMERARIWYQRAAEQGNVKAMHNLGALSAGNSKGSPDYAAAALWFGKAAEYGLKDSQFNLAILFDSGLGVPRDLIKAYKWFAIAAKTGDQEAIRREQRAKPKLTAAEFAAARAEVDAWSPRAKKHLVNNARAAGELWKRRSAATTAQ